MAFLCPYKAGSCSGEMPIPWLLSEPRPSGLDSTAHPSVLLLGTMFFIISTWHSSHTYFTIFCSVYRNNICICISFIPILIFLLQVSTYLVTREEKQLTMRISKRRKHKILNLAEWMCQSDTFTRHKRNNWIHFSDSKCVYWAKLMWFNGLYSPQAQFLLHTRMTKTLRYDYFR